MNAPCLTHLTHPTLTGSCTRGQPHPKCLTTQSDPSRSHAESKFAAGQGARNFERTRKSANAVAVDVASIYAFHKNCNLL